MFGNPFRKRSPPQGAARSCSTRTVSRASDGRKTAAKAHYGERDKAPSSKFVTYLFIPHLLMLYKKMVKKKYCSSTYGMIYYRHSMRRWGDGKGGLGKTKREQAVVPGG